MLRSTYPDATHDVGSVVRHPSVYPLIEAELVRQGIGYAELARRLGWGISRVSDSLRGVRSCGTFSRKRLAEGLGFKADDADALFAEVSK